MINKEDVKKVATEESKQEASDKAATVVKEGTDSTKSQRLEGNTGVTMSSGLTFDGTGVNIDPTKKAITGVSTAKDANGRAMIL